MSCEDRKRRVAGLFSRIAFTAELYKDDTRKRDQLIKKMVDELWAITKVQLKNNELPHCILIDE